METESSLSWILTFVFTPDFVPWFVWFCVLFMLFARHQNKGVRLKSCRAEKKEKVLFLQGWESIRYNALMSKVKPAVIENERTFV